MQTALSTQWALYLLAENPETQEDLLASGSSRDAFLQGVVKEALRLYPVAPFLTRILPASARIGDFELPAGVCTNQVFIHPLNQLINR